jgi:hypothetical protein
MNILLTFHTLVKLAEIVILLLCEDEQYISQKAIVDWIEPNFTITRNDFTNPTYTGLLLG